MTIELQIELFEQDADAERLDMLTDTLRQDLLTLDVDSVSRISRGDAPEGSKGLDPAAVGAVLVALKSSVELVGQVVSVLRSWLGRGGASTGSTQSLKLTMNGQTLELSAATADQQQQILDAFVAAAAPDRSRSPTAPRE